jgi:hypothetical protein
MAYQKLQTREALAVITSDDVRIPDPNTVVVLDTATGATVGAAAFNVANTLTDVGTKFLDAGINVGAIVYNTTSGKAYHVVSVDSDTQLTLSGATAGGATDSYSIYTKSTIGCTLFVGVSGDVKVQMAQQNGNTSTAATPANEAVTYKNIADGSFLPIQVVRVDDNTTATDIIAMW